jgi:hypothetical protein
MDKPLSPALEAQLADLAKEVLRTTGAAAVLAPVPGTTPTCYVAVGPAPNIARLSRSLDQPIRDDAGLAAEMTDALAGSAHLVYASHDRHPSEVVDFDSLPESEKGVWRKVATIVATLTAAHCAENADRQGAVEGGANRSDGIHRNEVVRHGPAFNFSVVRKQALNVRALHPSPVWMMLAHRVDQQ